MNQAVPRSEVLIETCGALALVTLNRPDAHNALSLEMIREIRAALNGWAEDESIEAVLFMGAGDKAFCAGGDIKAFYYSGMDCRRGLVTPRVPMVFFGEEYALNKQIFHYSKPTIAFMDGITMGGGYGIAGHCKVRIASAGTVFAMPEAGIGFFPDVGSMYQLVRCPGNYGRYLALTGHHIDGKTMIAAGLADFYIEDAENLSQTVEQNLGCDDLGGALKTALRGVDDFDLNHADVIESAFTDCDVSAICGRLRENDDDFAFETLAILEMRSPISVMVVAAYLDKAQRLGFDEIITMDLALCQKFILQQDMYEDIRAQLIDKDKSPQWCYQALGDVSQALVDSYFTPCDYDLKDVRIF